MKRFWSLPNGADFFLGERLYFKVNVCTATPALFSLSKFVFVAPWRAVRLTHQRMALTELERCEEQIAAIIKGSPSKFPSSAEYATKADDARDALTLALLATGAASSGKTEAYASELRRRYPDRTFFHGRTSYPVHDIIGEKPYDPVELERTRCDHWANQPQTVIRNMEFDHGNIQPHQDDERTGPSA